MATSTTSAFTELRDAVCAAANGLDAKDERAEGRLQRALLALTQQPRATREHAPVDAIVNWVNFQKKSRGLSLLKLSQAIGLKASGPVSAAMRGRPLSVDRFKAWQEAVSKAAIADPIPAKRTRKANAKPAARKPRQAKSAEVTEAAEA